MSSPSEHRCICRHANFKHLTDAEETVCLVDGCKCSEYFEWQITYRDPGGKLHIVHDIAKFVRDNGHLFGFSEIEPTFYNGAHKGLANVYIPAEQGLTNLNCNRNQIEWHGWTVAQFPKTYHEKQIQNETRK
jgi:hypothetical protein